MSNLGGNSPSADTDKSNNVNGADGAPGAPGANGTNGTNGTNGVDGIVASIVAGTNVTVDATDPANPIVSATGGTGGQVDSIVAGTNITVDATDPVNPIVSSTAAASPLTTKGDVYTFDTADQRLAVGTAGQVLTADAAEATGLKWATPAAGGGGVTVVGGRFAPPLASDFPTWVNQLAATVTDDPYEGFILYDGSTSTGADQIIARVKPLPTGGFIATCRISMGQVLSSFNTVGLLIRDSATGKNVILRLYGSGTSIIAGFANYTGNTFSAAVGVSKAVTHNDCWLRFEDDTVNFIGSYSRDGVNFFTLGTQVRTAFAVTPDQIGMFIDPESAAPCGLACRYYDDKDTPAVLSAPIVAGAPMTTKGDIVTYDTDVQRLAIGTDAQVLTADSAEATGMKWATPAAGGAAATLISIAPTGSTESFSSSANATRGAVYVCNSTVDITKLIITTGADASATYKVMITEVSGATNVIDVILYESAVTVANNKNTKRIFDLGTVTLISGKSIAFTVTRTDGIGTSVCEVTLPISVDVSPYLTHTGLVNIPNNAPIVTTALGVVSSAFTLLATVGFVI